MGKFCSACETLLPLHAFHDNGQGGLQERCIECTHKHWLAKLEKRRKAHEAKPQDAKDLVIIRSMMKSARKRAKRDGIEFTITEKDIKLVHVCPIRDVPLVRNEGKISPDNYSFDRQDNSKGYVPGNVYVISWLANQAKSNMNIAQVEKLLKYMKGDL